MAREDAVLDGISSVSHVLSPCNLRHLAREWLKEDVPTFDYGGFVVGEREEHAVILMKSPGVLAGRPFTDAVFQELDCAVQWLVQEGEEVQPVKVVAKVTGKIRHLLLGERVSLNCLSRASGIATAARRVRHLAQSNGWKGEVAGTRKTTPGFRMVEKYALLVGGVSTHRYDLSAMIMLKDNHIWSAGSISQAVKDAHVVGGFCTKVEVECRSLEEACEAAQAGADVVMLDNFQPEAAAECAKELKSRFPKLLVEVSGGITEENILQYCHSDIDILSMSCLTQGYATVDLSMKIAKEGRDPSNPTVQLHDVPGNSE